MNTLGKKISLIACFWNYRLQKPVLLTCLKNPVSEHLWVVNMLKAPGHCLTLHSSIYVIFFDQSEIKTARKILPLYYLKSWDCFLTYWHPMENILSQKKRVFHATNSNAIIQKSQIFFPIFCCISEIYINFRTLWKKRWAWEIICFWN